MPILNDDAFERTRRTVLRDEMRYADQPKEGTRRVRFKGGCKGRNEVWIIAIAGSPTAGTFDVDVTVNDVTETLTFNFDDTAAEVKTELATHTELSSAVLDTDGGPFPKADIGIEFIGDLAKTQIVFGVNTRPVFDWSSLTGGAGVFVAWSQLQPGYPKRGNS